MADPQVDFGGAPPDFGGAPPDLGGPPPQSADESRQTFMQYHPGGPAEAASALRAGAQLSPLVHPAITANNPSAVAEGLYGKKMKATELWGKIESLVGEGTKWVDRAVQQTKGTIGSINATNQLNALSQRQMRGGGPGKDTALDQQIADLSTQADPKDHLGAVPSFILNLPYQLGYQGLAAADTVANEVASLVTLEPLRKTFGILPGTNFEANANWGADAFLGSFTGAVYRGRLAAGVSNTNATLTAVGAGLAQAALFAVKIPGLGKAIEAGAGAGATSLEAMIDNAVAKGATRAAAERLIYEAAEQGTLKPALSGVISATARVGLPLAQQATYGILGAAVNDSATVISDVLHNAVSQNKIPLPAVESILADLGIGAAGGLVMGAGAELIGAGSRLIKGGFLDRAVQDASAQVDRAAVVAETGREPPPHPIETATAEKMSTATVGDILDKPPEIPEVKKVGEKPVETLAMTEAQGTALDLATRSEEGTSNYIERNPTVEKLTAQIEELQAQVTEGKAEFQDRLTAAKAEKASAIASLRAQIKQRADTQRYMADLKKVDTTHMHPEIAAGVEALIGSKEDPLYNMASPSKKTLAFAAELRSQLASDPTADITDSQKALLDRVARKNFRELTPEEQKTLHDQVMYYEKLQRDSTQIMLDRRMQDRQEVVRKAIGEMPEQKAVRDEIQRASPTLADRILKGKRWVKNAFGDHMMGLDYLTATVGGKTEDSVFYKSVFKQVHAGESPDAVRNGGEIGALRYGHEIDDQQRVERQKLLESVKNIDAWRSQKVSAGGMELTHGERVSMYMLWEQAASKKDLVEGGWGSRSMPDPNKVNVTKMDQWYELMASITDDEKEAARALGLGFKKIGQDVNTQHTEVKNYPMDVVENYFPIDVMPISRGTTEEIQTAKDIARGRYNIGLPKGRTMERTGAVKPVYVRDAFEVFAEHRDWAAEYIHVDQPLVNAVKVLRDTQAEITARWGTDTYKEIDDRLHKVLGNAENETKIGQLFSRLRGSYVSSVLNLNPISIAANLMNFERFVSAGLVDTKHAMVGLMDSLVHPRQVHNELKTWSPEYRSYHAEGGFNKDMREALGQGGRNTSYGRGRKVLRRVLGYPARLTDRITVRAGMRGAFLRAMDEMKAGSLSKDVSTALGITNEQSAEMSQTQKMTYAYRYAEHALEHANSVPTPTLMSGLHQGGWFEQTIGTFGSDAVRAQQLFKQTIRNAVKDKTPKSFRRLAALTTGLFLLEPLHYIVLNYYRQNMLSAKKPPTPEDMKKAFSQDPSKGAADARKYLGFEFLDQASYYFPLIRDVVRPVAAAATGQYSQNSLLITDEYTRLLSRSMGAAAKLASGTNTTKEWSTLMDNGLHLVFALMGLPYTTPKFWAGLAKQIASGVGKITGGGE